MANITPRYWEHQNSAYIYADAKWGHDNNDGTMAHPVRTIEKALSLCPDSSAAKTIVLRGDFFLSSTLVDEHCTTLMGDYYGAATIHGNKTHGILWFASTPNLILDGCRIDAAEVKYRHSTLTSNFTNYGIPYGGFGRAHVAGDVGLAYVVCGASSSLVILNDCTLWRGAVGGTANQKIVYSSPVKNASCFVSENGATTACTMYNALFSDGQIKGYSSQYTGYWGICKKNLYSKWSIFINAAPKTYNACFFASDCNFYWASANKSDSAVYYLVVLGDSSLEKGKTLDAATQTCIVDGCESIEEAVRYLASTTSGNGLTVFDTDCIFSTVETAETLFNDIKGLDFSLNPDSEAANGGQYFGACPPALKISVLKNSDGHINCFNHRTIDGDALSINNENELCVDTSRSTKASILSKIIRINPTRVQIDGIYSLYLSKKGEGVVLADNKEYPFLGEFVAPSTDSGITGQNLVAGKSYIVTIDDAVISYNGTSYTKGDVFDVVSGGNLYYESESEDEHQVRELVINAQYDVIYCRCRAMIYKYASQSDVLIAGCTYYNAGNKTVHINNADLDIIAGDTYVCRSQDSFVCEGDSDYKLAIMFDDRTSFTEDAPRQVPASEIWIPYRMWGEIFVSKANGLVTMLDGIPESSGNVKSWGASGKSIQGVATIINQPYTQFKIVTTPIAEL